MLKNKLKKIICMVIVFVFMIAMFVPVQAGEESYGSYELTGSTRACFIKGTNGGYMQFNYINSDVGSVSLSNFTGASNQMWLITKISDGLGNATVRIFSNYNKNYALYVNHSGAENGEQIFAYNTSTDSQINGEQFKLSVDNYGQVMFKTGTTNYTSNIVDTGNGTVQQQTTANHPSGRYWTVIDVLEDQAIYFIRNVNTKKYLSVKDASTNSGAKAVLYPYDGGNHQQWKASFNSYGCYTFTSMVSTSPNLRVADYSDVKIKDVCTGYPSYEYRQWKLFITGNNAYKIQLESNPNKCLGFTPNNNNQVTVFQYSNSTNYQWELIKISPAYYTGSAHGTSYSSLHKNWSPNMWSLDADYYNGLTPYVKTKAEFTFTNSEVNNLGNTPFCADVTSHGNGTEQMSAYFAITNLPSPVIDIERDNSTNICYPESEAVCKNNYQIVANKEYFLYTFWNDYRNGNNDGCFALDFGLCQKLGGEYNPINGKQTGRIDVLNYGKRCGYAN